MPERLLRLLLLLAACLLSLTFLASHGTSDVTYYWLQWLQNSAILGPVEGYRASSSDYPPLTHLFLFLLAKLSSTLSLSPFLALKWSMVAMLFLSAAIFAAWTKDLLAPAVLIITLLMNSVALGYLDIWTAPFFIGAMWALQRNRLFVFAILFSTASLIKWQPLIIAPFLLIYILRTFPPTQPLRSILPPVLVIVGAVAGIFSVSEVRRALSRALGHTMISGNALNLGWIVTYFLHVFWPATFGRAAAGTADYIYIESARTATLSKLGFELAYLAVLVMFWKKRMSFENLMAFSLLGYLTYFLFNIGVHESHLFQACLLGAILWHVNPGWKLTFAAWAAAANINLLVFYGLDGGGLPFPRAVHLDISVCFAAINVALYGVLCWMVLRGLLSQQDGRTMGESR